MVLCTTVEEAIKAESCAMAVINIHNHDAAVRILTILIGESILYFNVGKNMGPAQIKIVIDMLLSDPITKNLKPEDYKVLFEDMKKGYYGNLYDRFDGQIIFQNATKYADKKQSIIEKEAITQHEARVKSDGFIHPVILPYLKQLVNEIPKEEKKVITEEDKKLIKPKHQEPDEKTKFIQGCFIDFEKEYKSNPVKTPNPCDKFINYNNEVLDQIEYVKRRLSEKYP